MYPGSNAGLSTWHVCLVVSDCIARVSSDSIWPSEMEKHLCFIFGLGLLTSRGEDRRRTEYGTKRVWTSGLARTVGDIRNVRRIYEE